MSGSTGQIIGGIVGAVIGFYAGGNVAAGWAIGSAIGGAVDPQRIDGPHLQDRKVQVSTYGASIPIIYGGDAGTGNIIWASDLAEHDVEEGKGGGPVVTNHTYSASLALLVGEGPIPGVRRIWADAKLVYDVSDDADGSTQAASSLFGSYFTFYSGDETQLPDPTIEAALGVGNVPAYRGCCYLVFTDLPLQEYGNRIPNFRVETSEARQSVGSDGGITYEPLKVGQWRGDRPEHGDGSTQYRDMTLTHSWTDYVVARVANASFEGGSSSFSDKFIAYQTSTNNLPSLFAGGATLADDPQYVYYCMAFAPPTVVLNTRASGLPAPDGAAFCGPAHNFGGSPDDGLLYWSLDAPNIGDIGNCIFKISTTLVTGTAPYTFVNNCVNFPGGAPFPYALGNHVIGLRAERVPGPPPSYPGCLLGDPCLLGTARVPGRPEYCIDCDGNVTPNTSITYEVVTGTFKQVAEVSYRSGVLYQNGLGPVLLPDDPDYNNGTFWAAARADAIAAGLLKSDVSVPVIVTKVAKGTRSTFTRYVAAERNTTLSAIVADLCERAGMTSGTYDVTALASIPVQGFAIARQMPARGALQPLQQAFWWDFVESGRSIKAVLRGAAPVDRIGPDDLGATDGDTPLVEVIPNRGQEAELPASVTVSYSVRAKGYEMGTQRARRVTTGSKQEQSVEMPIVLDDQKGAEIADVLMYSSWTNRTQRSWNTTRRWAHYEPTDPVELDDGEFVYSVRITERSEEGGVIKWKGVDESPAGYSPNVSAAPGAGGGIGGVRFDGPMKLELIDCPILLDTNDDPGLYAAASGYMPSWRAGAAFKSVDAGASFLLVKSMLNKAAIGYASTVLGDWRGGNMVDELNSVTIRMHSGALSSITRAALMTNGNTAILGGEILQFQRAEQLTADTYRLTGLLRARKGTEQHLATHAVNDRFVLFTSASVYRLPGTLGELNLAEIWKGVTAGQTLDDAFAISFTNTGAGLKPLSPSHLQAVDIGGGMRRVKWVRRTRIGATWRAGVDAPLGETNESYFAQLLDSFGNRVSSATVSTPTWDTAGGLALSYSMGRSDNSLRRVGSLVAGLRQASNPFAGAVDTFDASTGAVVNGYFIGEQTTQLADDGAALFISTINGTSPSHVFRFDSTSLTAPTHTYNGTLNADCQGVAFDGANVWISESYSARIRKLSAANLSVVATYAIAGNPGRMTYGAGALWVCAGVSVIKVDPATGATLLSLSDTNQFADVAVVGSIVFAWSDAAVKTFNATTGALIGSTAISSALPRPARLAVFGGRVVFADVANAALVFLDASTGLVASRLTVPRLLCVAGSDAAHLFIEIDTPPSGSRTDAFGTGAFAGYSVRVYQLSSTVGRGFPATLQL